MAESEGYEREERICDAALSQPARGFLGVNVSPLRNPRRGDPKPVGHFNTSRPRSTRKRPWPRPVSVSPPGNRWISQSVLEWRLCEASFSPLPIFVYQLRSSFDRPFNVRVSLLLVRFVVMSSKLYFSIPK